MNKSKTDHLNLLQPKIVHIGFGAFHRAHQARYFDELYKMGLSDYGICGVNLYSGIELINVLKSDNYQYPILEQTEMESNLILINSVIKCLHPKIDGHTEIIEQIANPITEIVSLTITEKGYHIDESTQKLNLKEPAILHDLKHLTAPTSAIGFIIAGLKLRYERQEKPITILSCDNLQHNGRKIKTAILDFATELDVEFANWIASKICFPSTMVDRIVPAMTTESHEQFTKITGLAHQGALMTESFKQWVIEDNFAQPRPKLEHVGVQFVANVGPFEEMKLGMLNASHSFLAYLGFLAGFKTIDAVIHDPDFKKATLQLLDRYQIPTLQIKDSQFLMNYAHALIERFANPHLKHQTQQIAQDGSLKIPQRLLPSVKWHLSQNSTPILPILAIVGWMRYITGKDEQQIPIQIVDPKAAEFKAIFEQNQDYKSNINALLSITTIFGHELPQDKLFVDMLYSLYEKITQMGAHTLVKSIIEQEYKL